jgi:hypothetical protein
LLNFTTSYLSDIFSPRFFYCTRRLPPNMVGLSSEKSFPSTSALWVVHTSFTIIPCAQLARYFAGFEQLRTSQTPSLTESKYRSVFMFAIEDSPVLFAATRLGRSK